MLSATAAWLARRDLASYGDLVHGHPPALHHQRWAAAISDLVEGRSATRKLLLVAPPGHAKSTWVSLILPPWYLGRHPGHALLFFTSNDTMARQFGGTVKTTFEGNEIHAEVFGGTTRPDAGRGWSTDGLYLAGVPAGSKDPSYRALGYGASVIGARAHGIILDDPLAQEAAQSENEQSKAKRYFDMTVDSRLHPDGWMLAIMTRWHENDLASHLASKPDWTVLAMPAIGDYPWGTALWPERFSQDWLEAKRADIGGPLFNCLYQNDPTSMGGSVFREASWFRALPPEYEVLRPRLQIVQFWDLAYSERATGDFTACVTVGIDPLTQRLFVPHVWRQRVGEAGLEEAMAEQIIASGARIIGVEEAAYRQRATQDLIARLNGRLSARGYAATATAIKVTTDKVFRARLPAGRAEGGYLYVDRAAPWFPAFEAECLGFPLAAHDDQVDALSGAVQLAIERGRVPSRQGQEMTFLGGTQPMEHDPRFPSQLVAQHMAGVAAGQD